MTNHTTRATFSTRLGAIAAAAGSAIGLGNIWRFPYMTGENGGAAFLLIYLGAVLMLGIPLMIAEFLIGRTAHSDVAGAFRKLLPGTRWYMVGGVSVLVATLILGFYSVISGWTVEYAWRALTNDFAASVESARLVNPDVSTAEVLTYDFGQFSTTRLAPILWTTLFIAVNALILLGGVKKGIERASNVLMPILFVLLVVLCVNSLTLPGAADGLRFLFHPDFSKVTGATVLAAMGQAFFSMSVGMGCLIIYGSYLGDNTKLGKNLDKVVSAAQEQLDAIRRIARVAGLDTLLAILAGVIIFPACYSYGIKPDAGPSLIFVTLPNVFLQMPGGYVWCLMFFLLVVLAALTSTISLFEAEVTFYNETLGLTRTRSIVVASVVTWLLCVASSLSLGAWSGFHIAGMTVFDFCDFVTASVLMPIGAMLISLFVGWRLDRAIVRDAITNWQQDSGWYIRPFIFMLRFVCPLCILLIFMSGLGLFG